MSADPQLRPYYDADSFNAGYSVIYKPGFGVIDTDANRSISSTLSTTAKGGTVSEFVLKAVHNANSSRLATSQVGIGLKKHAHLGTKNVYSDLEFLEYFEIQNINDLARKLLNSFAKNYMRVLTSQPFEICRLLLQLGAFDHKKSVTSLYVSQTATDDENSDDEEINYFLAPGDETPTRLRARRPSRVERLPTNLNHINPLTHTTVDIISSLFAKEGMKGLWRGVNASFIYTTLSSTIEAWITGVCSPFLQIPDPYFLQITDSPDPMKSLLLSVVAAVLTGLILAPLDLIRTRLIITSTQTRMRSIREMISGLKHYYVPLPLMVPTALLSVVGTVFRKATPFVLFTKCNIDAYSSPVAFSTMNLFASISELVIKLPLETVLRNLQASYLLGSENFHPSLATDSEDLVVNYKPRPFWEIGVRNFFNGWRVGVLNVVGTWGLDILRSTNDQREEKL
ncbi:hypothetical protein BABINDRAFT_29555, partial [Babjeviella inositovora NRRL Y-12698]